MFKLSGKRRKPYGVRVTVGWSEDNKQIYRYLGYFEKKQDAIIALAEYNKNPYDIDARNITFEEVFQKWSEVKFKKVKRPSRVAYTANFNKCQELHKMKFRDLRKTHFQGCIDRHREGAPSILPKLKQLFGQMTRYALENDIVDKDYTQHLDVDVEGRKPKGRTIFTTEEIERLWESLYKVPNVDIVLILIYTGMRITELCNIRRANINLADRYIVGGIKTAAGTDRVIPISKKIIPLIENRLRNTPSGYLIYNKWGQKMNKDTFATNYMKPMMAELGMKHIAHECRHTCISMLNSKNVNPVVIKRIVGHANSDVTEHYTHFELDILLEAIDKI